jgi:hypothetical protein
MPGFTHKLIKLNYILDALKKSVSPSVRLQNIAAPNERRK